jgi:hypothetical protein
MTSTSKAQNWTSVFCRPGMQRVKIGDSVDAQDYGLTIDYKLLSWVPERSLRDPEDAWSNHNRHG